MGGYFITINTQNRRHYFGDVMDGEMILNEIWIVCNQKINEINKRKIVQVHESIILPNHIHMIIILSEWDTKRNDVLTNRNNVLINRKDASLMRPERFTHAKRPERYE